MIDFRFLTFRVWNEARNRNPILVIVLLPIVGPLKHFCPEFTAPGWLDLGFDDVNKVLQGKESTHQS